MCHLLESHRSIGKTSCRLTMTSALLDPHPKTCPWSTFIAADGRCSCFVNHDRVPALKAIRKRSARRVESCQQVSFSASFLRFLKARVAAPLPARGFKQGGGSSSDGRDACRRASGRPTLGLSPFFCVPESLQSPRAKTPCALCSQHVAWIPSPVGGSKQRFATRSKTLRERLWSWC